jgi:hypothetical protein
MIDLIEQLAVTARLQHGDGCNHPCLPDLDQGEKHQLNIGVGQ